MRSLSFALLVLLTVVCAALIVWVQMPTDLSEHAVKVPFQTPMPVANPNFAVVQRTVAAGSLPITAESASSLLDVSKASIDRPIPTPLPAESYPPPRLAFSADRVAVPVKLPDEARLATFNQRSDEQALPMRPDANSVAFISQSIWKNVTSIASSAPTGVAGAQPIVELAPGVKEPAALLKHEGFASIQQEEAMDKVAQGFDHEFSETVSDPAAGMDVVAQAWADAKARADARYRLLFGDAAFNQASAEAAREALATEQAQ